MIIKGLRAIEEHMANAYHNNMQAWYEHNLPDNARPRGMRKDVYISSRVHDAEQRRIAELEREVEYLKRQQKIARDNAAMYEAMGPDYDPNGFATYP
jgi:hypothetical protein